MNGIELDAAIRERLNRVPTVEEWGGWSRSVYAAFVGILDMHKPYECAFGDVHVSYLCTECYYRNAYPCPTVQEILDAFGIEYEVPA